MSTQTNLFTAQVVTATSTSPSIQLAKEAPQALAYLEVTAVSGTSPSLTVTFQESPDGTNWVNVPSGAMSAVTATGTTQLQLDTGSTEIGPYLRAQAVATGTSPSFTINLILELTD